MGKEDQDSESIIAESVILHTAEAITQDFQSLSPAACSFQV